VRKLKTGTKEEEEEERKLGCWLGWVSFWFIYLMEVFPEPERPINRIFLLPLMGSKERGQGREKEKKKN
jgi:hypothetical protein